MRPRLGVGGPSTFNYAPVFQLVVAGSAVKSEGPGGSSYANERTHLCAF